MSRQPVSCRLFLYPQLMLKDLLHYFDYRYFLRFTCLFLSFYAAYTFVHAASVPSGLYFPFVEQYLNFPILIRYTVLHAGQLGLSFLGYSSDVVDDRLISYDGFAILQMAWACYGLGVKSFWIAFVCAHQMSLKKKVLWSIGGVLTILILNSVRVIVMMVSILENWTIAEYLGTNAHDLFNYLCYTALLGLIMLFYAKVKPTDTHKRPTKASISEPHKVKAYHPVN